jgi:hypothetical protein
MTNSTWISVSENYLELSDDFYLNNLIFIRNIKTNRACLVYSELLSSSVE